MKRGTRVYVKGAPYKGVGTVLWVQGLQVTVRWSMKGLVRVHRASALQPLGVPMH